jgi:hypothetical protein
MIKELKQLEVGLYQQAFKAHQANDNLGGFNFSDFLFEMVAKGELSEELASPERPGTAVSQLLVKAGVNLNSDRAGSAKVFNPAELGGKQASAILYPAFAMECFERGMGLNMSSGGTIVSSPSVAGSTTYPQAIRPAVDQRLPDNPNEVTLGELVGSTTSVSGDGYKSAIIEQQNYTEYELLRVAEGAELPKYTIKTGEREVKLLKYGGQVESTYEVNRRSSIDFVARTWEQIGLSEARKMIKIAIQILLNGDGNANSTAINTNNTTVGGTSGAYDELALMKWLVTVAATYGVQPTVFVGDLTEVLEMMEVPYRNTNYATPAALRQMQGSFMNLLGAYPLRNAPVGSLLDASGKILGVNPGRGLELVYENGSQIQEADRYITRQVTTSTLTYNMGFGKPNRQHAHTLTRTA